MQIFKNNKIWIVVIGIILIISGVVFTKWTIKQSQYDLCNNLQIIGALAANAVNYNEFSTLKGTDADSSSQYYRRRKEQLVAMRVAIPHSKLLYLIGQRSDGTFFFYLDSEPSESKAYSAPGQIYSKFTNKIRHVFQTGKNEVMNYSDRLGDWVSVFVPIVDRSNGKILAVLGIDIDSGNWDLKVIKNAGLSIGLFLMVLTMTFSLILIARSRLSIKKHKRQIEESEKRIRILFENSPDPYLIIIDKIIIDCNKAAEILLKGSKQQIIGKTPSELSPVYQPDGIASIDKIDPIIENSINSGNHIFEWVHCTFNGENIWIEVSISSMTFNDRQALFVDWRNITERKIAEAELAMLNDQLRISHEAIEANLYQKNALIEKLTATQIELEQINSEKDKLFTIIAHDLKNPFVALINNADLLLENFYSLEDSKKIYMIRGMKEASQATHSLLENLLQWSRAQRDLIQFEPSEFNLFIVIHSSIDSLNLLIEHKSITFINSVPIGLYIEADKNLITTIIRNIVSNAIKFTPEFGTIEIRVDESDTEYTISITDSGVGIDQYTITQLFDISTHVSTRGTSGEKGTGLGLLLCKDLVEMHGGQIWAESEVGLGSTFYFTLPIN